MTKYQDFVLRDNCVKSMSHFNDCALSKLLINCLLNKRISLLIYIGSGLVHHHNFTLPQNGSS